MSQPFVDQLIRAGLHVRVLSDAEALELQIIENLERQDVHAMDEAEAYARLRDRHKHDVARIAERVGRSVAYVYDRLRLLELTSDAKKLFREGRLTPGHAVTLARLKPADQKKALDPHKGGVFEHEDLLWDPEDESWSRPNANGLSTVKLRTVRELQGWIDEHVKLDVASKDLPQLFPDLHQAVTTAKDDLEKIVPITHDHTIHPDARDGQRVFGPRSWVRADGKLRSKVCERSSVGVVVVGPGRGESLRVCVDKRCDVHFEKPKQRAGNSSTAKATQETLKKQEDQRRAQHEKEAADRKRWEKATPAILKAVAEKISTLSVTAGTVLGKRLIREAGGWNARQYKDLVSPGKTAEDLVRHLAFMDLVGEVNAWDGNEEFPKTAKALGIDTAKILNEVAPVPPPAAEPAAKGKDAKVKAAKPAERRKAKPAKTKGGKR